MSLDEEFGKPGRHRAEESGMNSDGAGSARRILLGGYAAKNCPRATHNEYDRTVPRPDVDVPPAKQQRLDLGGPPRRLRATGPRAAQQRA
jgi:hypothetical protein